MIQANELMTGDFVRVGKDVCFKKGTVVEIRGIDADMVFPEMHLKGCAACVAAGDPDRASGGVWLEYLEPVPVTPEILLGNGFYAERNVGYVYNDYDGHEVIFDSFNQELRILCNRDVVLNVEEWDFPVHKLQNFLRLCEVEKDIKLEDVAI